MDPGQEMRDLMSVGTDRVDAGKQRLRFYKGRPVSSFITDERIEELQSFKQKKGDIWIATYPKSGTTWCQYVAFLLAGNEPNPNFAMLVPWLEVGTLFRMPFEKLPHPQEGKLRLFKSHWWADMHMLPNGQAKFIYIMRNGLDVAVSFYHHTYALRLYGYEGTLDHFFELFMEGDVDNGSWWDHCLGWWERSKAADDVLFLHYEDIKADPASQFRRIADFMGVQASDDRIQEVVSLTTVQAMKDLAASAPGHEQQELVYRRAGSAPHIRNGVVGEGRQVLTKQQRARFLAQCERQFANSDIPWRKYVQRQ
mmetsp:Transcript_19021/g.73237  ORF Transcript_19021/g.73237 Transcript_19021/m.73237 type:complete len:310 (+) Transcript_19021:30-959(+)